MGYLRFNTQQLAHKHCLEPIGYTHLCREVGQVGLNLGGRPVQGRGRPIYGQRLSQEGFGLRNLGEISKVGLRRG